MNSDNNNYDDNDNNNSNNTTFNFSINLTKINSSNINDSSCVLFSLVTNSLVINSLDSRANILQSVVDMCNLPSSFQFEKSQRERMPLTKHTNNEHTLAEVFPGLFSLGYTFKREKPLTRTQITYLLCQLTEIFVGYQTL